MMSDSMVFLAPEDGPTYRVLSDLITFKLVSEQTQNAFFLCFVQVPPQSEVAMHTQAGQETFIVFDGEVEFSTLTDQKVLTYPAASRGAVIHVPEGVPHAYKNTSDAPASLIVLFAPGGAERFFRRLGISMNDNKQEVASHALDPDNVADLLQRYNVQLVTLPPES